MSTLMVAETGIHDQVLGPGRRFVVWVQGCPLRCEGCVSPQWLSFQGGTPRDVAELAEEIVGEHQLDGLTFSGGEPFAQADQVADLIRLVRLRRDLSAVSYSGFTLEMLRRSKTAGHGRLLAELDLLIDGPYRRDLHAALLWRASRNQRLHVLGPRISLGGRLDSSAGLQVDLSSDGVLSWAGVPPISNFVDRLSRNLAEQGVVITSKRVPDE